MDILKRFEQKGYKLVAAKVTLTAHAIHHLPLLLSLHLPPFTYKQLILFMAEPDTGW